MIIDKAHINALRIALHMQAIQRNVALCDNEYEKLITLLDSLDAKPKLCHLLDLLTDANASDADLDDIITFAIALYTDTQTSEIVRGIAYSLRQTLAEGEIS